MGRLLALDYGTKRTGIAVTDELQLIASGLCTVNTKDLMDFLKTYISENQVDCVIIGYPKQMNNQESDSEKAIQNFIDIFRNQFSDLEIVRQDERFTSKMAFQTMIDSGLNKKQRRNKALIDEISATIILQDYLYNKSK